MSRHTFQLQHEGRAVEVMMGWDRPLQQVFMVVEAIDSEDGSLYSNLDVADPSRLRLEDFRQVLADLKIPVPESMFVETDRDRCNNVGNRIVVHQADSSFKVICAG